MLSINKKFIVFTILIFIIEVLIALYVKDAIIRPYGGDFLVVILIYCAVRSFVEAAPLKVAGGVLLFSYLVEVLQYLHIVDVLGLQDNDFARIVIGYGFDWLDLLAYTLGIIAVLAIEKLRTEPSLLSQG